MHRLQPLANGLHTDHPVPGLSFVDDSHIPVDDPAAIEAIGRHEEGGTWGRWDRMTGAEGSWIAFTTDSIRQDLAWVIRHHPEHGRTVLLVRDEDASPWHSSWWGPQLLFRQGGYWWDGTTWYRPDQVWDAAGERFYRRPVKAATAITAADLLDDNAHPNGGRLLKVANFDLEAPPPDTWNDHLALWASRRPADARPLSQCVVRLSAPELAADQLIGVPEMAKVGNIAASTLRAYIARNQRDVPPPQATINGRSLWARPVADDWAEERDRSPESAAAKLDSGDGDFSIGLAELRQRLARRFFSALWERPDWRKRWALRFRTESAVHEIADNLAFSVAADTGDIINTHDLAATVRHAFLDEFASGKELDEATGDTGPTTFYGITTPVTHMLDWLIRHHPRTAHHLIGEIIGDAERRMDIPREVSADSIRTALGLDSKLPRQVRLDFLERALPPASR
ncbi:hypothetical protein ACFYWH_44735 [Streptomyces sp. NPDC003737]|uniref:hypothetical protein n=1 Tax=Streptomyces sp. NPDC003737 TaxID=3364685 RepID=UPI0036CEF936